MRSRCLLLAMAVFALPGAAARPAAAEKPARANVLLVTLDTTRPDHLPCYGYGAGDTPTFDALAARGAVFTEAFTSAPMTLPAHATILTGLDPPEHGLHVNGKEALGSGVDTLAGTLAAQGYHTAAFVAAFVLNRKFGLDRGFQIFDDSLAGAAKQEVPERLSISRPGNLVTDAALAWLDRATGSEDAPFFSWVHLYDAHYPYASHPELAGTRFADAATYDAEIAFMDRQVGRLLAFLEAHQLTQSTLVVVVGDHGEGLGEHGEVEHGYLLNAEALRVPLITSLPDHIPAGVRIPALVSLADVTPTILDVLGIAAPTASRGRSLKPAFAGVTLPAVPSYSETDLPYTSFGWSQLRSLITAEWHYIRTTRPELYDRSVDPRELHNLAHARADEVAAMDAALTAVEAHMADRREATPVVLAPGDRARLRALGYVGADPVRATPPAPPRLPDIKDMLAVKHLENQLVRGRAMGTLGKDEVLEMAHQLVARSPKSPGFQRELGDALAAVGRFDEARGPLMEALRLRPDFAEAHGSLGDVLTRQGRNDEAMEHYAEAVRLDPDFAPAQVGLGNLLAARGERKAALRAYIAAVRVDHDYAEAHNNMANVLAQLGRPEPAIAQYRAAARAKPDFLLPHYNLGRLLARLGRRDEAIAEFQETLRLAPDFAEARQALADIQPK